MDGFSTEVCESIRLTIELAILSTAILLIVGTPLAWWLARSKTVLALVVGNLVMLPLVLPQTVLGFSLLMLLGPHGPGGALAAFWGARSIAFTFAGIVVGSVLSALPLVVQQIQNGFVAMGDRPLEVAATLRASPLRAFFTVALPLARPNLLTAGLLGFANTIGTFGAVLIIGGNIPGRTKVVSAFLIDYVQASRWREASWLAGGMLAFSLAVILTVTTIDKCSHRSSR
ncbi:molybdate ABC transporter permease subunit [Bradyrhizobium sp. STM 3562]|uniref:molybdate ABC transporter permease subunit n=1 Tax=Bradyrhizobium sp. STM 3562 TaxID=578924 RepID=UPI00388E02A2